MRKSPRPSPRFRDRVDIDTDLGRQSRPCKYIPKTDKLWAITGEKGTYRLTHAPTGLGCGERMATQKQVVQYCWGLMAGVPLAAVNTRDATVVVNLTRENYLRIMGRSLVAAGLPEEDQHVEVEVTNVQTNETRLYSVSADDVIDGGHCTGPCECNIEPDAVCGNGWPGTCDALARC